MNKLYNAILRLFWMLLPTCRETVSLISRDRDGGIGWFQRLRMKVHLRFCALCARYLQQIELMAAGLRDRGNDPNPKVPREVLDRMKDRLRDGR